MGATMYNHCDPRLSGGGVCIHKAPLRCHCELCKEESHGKRTGERVNDPPKINART